MKKELQFDAGNTRLKWRFINNGEVIHAGSIDNGAVWQDELPELFDRCGNVDRILMSSVSGGEHLQNLLTAAQSMSAAEIIIATTRKTFAGVTIAYDQPEKLGVDRWLAMLAAEDEFPNCLKVIVDCGTAITVDVVDQSGQHQGGYIVPGLRLMKESLAFNTADLGKVGSPCSSDGARKGNRRLHKPRCSRYGSFINRENL